MSASPRTVLIASAYFWPDHVGTAVYATGLATHLAAQGDRVIAIAGFSHYPAWAPQQPRRLRAIEQHEGVEVRRGWHFVPRSQSALRRALYEGTLSAGGLAALPLRRRPDVIIGVTPTLSGGVIAAAAAAVHRRPYALVLQDLTASAAEQSGVPGGRRVAGAVRELETRLARGAARVGIIAEGFRDYLEAAGVPASRIHRLRNWNLGSEPTQSRAELRARLGWAESEFVCLHGGNMGQKQGLDNVLKAAKLLERERVRVVLAGDGNDRERLEQLAQALQARNVQFVPMQPPGAYESMLGAADALLVNQRASVGDMALPSKLTSYFAAGRPVVAAADRASETAHEVERSGGGVVVDAEDPAALAESIMRLRTRPDLARELAALGGDYARERLTREHALREYDEFIGALERDAVRRHALSEVA